MKLLIALIATVIAITTVNAKELAALQVIAQPGNGWFFHRLQLDTTNGVSIRGRITSSNLNKLPPGQVKASVYGPNGELVDEAVTDYESPVLDISLRRGGGVPFQIDIKHPVQAGSVVKLSFQAKENSDD